MLASQAPAGIPTPWAASAGAGYIRPIPATSQQGITPGAASWPDGFPPLNFLPINAGGVPPFGQDMNGVLNALSAALQWEQVGGQPTFSAAFATAIGGYPNGAVLQSADGTGFWRSTTDNNTGNPDTGGPNWLPHAFFGALALTLGNVNISLTALQSARPTIILTGNLTGNVQITFPALVKQWLVSNQTTGAYTITCKTSGGSGVVLATGAQMIWGDGANINAVAIGASVNALIVGNSRNLTGAYLSTTTAKWTADELVVETALGGTPYRLAGYSQTLNLGLTGAGGIDVGSPPAGGWLYVYAIYNPSTGQASILGTSQGYGQAVYLWSNLPPGYTASALIGAVSLNGLGHFVQFNQLNQSVYISVVSILTNGNATVPTAISMATAVPPCAKTWGGRVDAVTACTVGIAADSLGTGAKIVGSASSTVQISISDVPLTTPQTTYYNISTAAAGCNLFVSSYTI